MFLLKSCILSRSNCKNGKVQHLHMQTACVTVIFKTLGLIRLSRILSYTNHESTKFQSLHLQLHGNTTHSKGLIASARLLGWLALPRCFYLGITWKQPARSYHFYIESGSSANEKCVTHCPVLAWFICRAA